MAKATKSFVLRLDSATMQAVEKWAADEFRSTNGQLQWIVADACLSTRRPVGRATIWRRAPRPKHNTNHHPSGGEGHTRSLPLTSHS